MREYYNRIQAGTPIDDVEIIDMHAHLGEYYNMHVPNAAAGSMIKMMDRCGINKTILSTTIGISSDFVLGNNLMLEAIKKYRTRFYGACLVNGNYPELSLQELKRCFDNDDAVVMIKIHPILTKCKLDDERMKSIYDYAVTNKIPILVHTWLDEDAYGNLDIFREVSKEYPEINWIMGHSGGPYGSRKAVQIAKELSNVYLDITLSMCPARQIEFFVEEVGSERVIFGTDNPFIDPRPQIGRVGLAEISQQDRKNIFSANAIRLIDFD
jgi:predicted TIM-barrel fold metal-dependent hydrolase